jgi:hypothetical protein
MFSKKTLANLKQSLADRHDAGVLSTSSSVLSYWIRLLNAAQDYCADRIGFVKSASLTTSSGSVALPDDFLVMQNVVDSSDLSWSLIASDQSDSAYGQAYWITGNQADGFTFNVPSGMDGTFTVYYSYRPENMVSDSDICIIPDPEAVVARAYGMLRIAETDPLEDAGTSIAECDRRLNEIIFQRNLNDGGAGFTLQNNA